LKVSCSTEHDSKVVAKESILLFALNITVRDGHEIFSSVPRLMGWFFQQKRSHDHPDRAEYYVFSVVTEGLAGF
jgi:hypothetical protein